MFIFIVSAAMSQLPDALEVDNEDRAAFEELWNQLDPFHQLVQTPNSSATSAAPEVATV